MAMYHPMEDANHCFFRMLLLASHVKAGVAIEAFRIMDFYCLFPSALPDVKLPRQLTKYKKFFKNIPKQFEPIPNKAALFDQLRHVQNNALGCLVSLGFIDRTDFLTGVVTWTGQTIPKNVLERMSCSPIVKEKWFEFITQSIPHHEIDGASGWKARTHLSEYRYDSV